MVAAVKLRWHIWGNLKHLEFATPQDASTLAGSAGFTNRVPRVKHTDSNISERRPEAPDLEISSRRMK